MGLSLLDAFLSMVSPRIPVILIRAKRVSADVEIYGNRLFGDVDGDFGVSMCSAQR